jgi:hypothetical protein
MIMIEIGFRHNFLLLNYQDMLIKKSFNNKKSITLQEYYGKIPIMIIHQAQKMKKNSSKILTIRNNSCRIIIVI